MRAIVTMTVETEDIIGLKEIMAACAERYGDVLFVNVEGEKARQESLFDVERAVREARTFRDTYSMNQG